MAQELELRVWNLELMVQLPPLASGKALSTSIDKKNIYNGFISVPPVILPLSFGQSVLNEGGFAQVSCIVTEGDEPLTIVWTFHGHTLSAALGIVTLLEEELRSRHSNLDTPAAAAGKYPELGHWPKRELPAAAGGRGKPDEVDAAGGVGNPLRGGLLCPVPALLEPVRK